MEPPWISKELILTNCIGLCSYRHIPFVGERRLGCCFVMLWIVDAILTIVQDHSCSVDSNQILEFHIFERQLHRVYQFASVIAATTCDQRLPCFSTWRFKASQLLWFHLCLWRIRRGIVVQWLLCFAFIISFSSWLLLCGIGSLEDIAGEVFVQDHFVRSIRCCVLLSFADYRLCRTVKRPGQWVIYYILLSRYALPNKYGGSCSEILLLLLLFQNAYESQTSEPTEIFQSWCLSRSMRGLVQSLAEYWSHWSAVLETDQHWDCKCPVLHQKSGIIHHASYVLHNCAVHLCDNSIRLMSVGRGRSVKDSFRF